VASESESITEPGTAGLAGGAKPASAEASLAPPRWISLAFPSLRSLGENPLYLRLSGGRFVRRPGLWRSIGPAELRALRGTSLTRVGLAPPALVLLLAVLLAAFDKSATIAAYSSPAGLHLTLNEIAAELIGFWIIFTILMVLLRAIGLGRMPLTKWRARRPEVRRRMSELCLTQIEPIEVDRALLGASLRFNALAIVGATLVFVVFYTAVQSIVDRAGFLNRLAERPFDRLVALFWVAATALYFVAACALDLASSFRGGRASLGVVAAQWPGLIFWIAALYMIPGGVGFFSPRSAANGALFVLCTALNFGAMVVLLRRAVERVDGRVGRRLFDAACEDAA
jgi:hypothetical protein